MTVEVGLLSGHRIQFGLHLPHSSAGCHWDRLLGFAPRIEALGFDSVWVRDNLSYLGPGIEGPGTTFVDPFVTLSSVAAVTRRLKLGTAVVAPFRPPLVTAQLFGSLAWVSRGRLEIGLGPGNAPRAFAAAGVPYEDRIQLCQETAEILRLVAGGRRVSYHGKITDFEDVLIDPAPPPSVPIWYGGASNASVRRALEYADGLLPGRCPFRHFDWVAAGLRAGAAERGRTVRIGSIPIVSIGRNREEALSSIDVPGLLDWSTKRWKSPCERLEDLAGALIVGSSEDCIEQIQAFVERGVHTLILDLRALIDRFEEVVEQVGEEVLPAFRR